MRQSRMSQRATLGGLRIDALPLRFLVEAELVTDRIGKGGECSHVGPMSVRGVITRPPAFSIRFNDFEMLSTMM